MQVCIYIHFWLPHIYLSAATRNHSYSKSLLTKEMASMWTSKSTVGPNFCSHDSPRFDYIARDTRAIGDNQNLSLTRYRVFPSFFAKKSIQSEAQSYQLGTGD